jgi:ABC-type multidrug transport system ATPase subunit/ABC-type multidrug transport system permease subunit
MKITPAIRAYKLKKVTEKGKTILQESTFDIPKEELIAVLGPSGCGKSTILKALNGDSPATSGRVWLSGLEFNEENFNTIKSQIGYVPQDDNIHLELSVEKTLYYSANLRLINSSPKEKKQKIEEVMKILKIDAIRKSKIEKISGGQRKRVAIARELLTDPPILFLDEPTSPLDPQTIKEFLKILKELTYKGTTVIMVTHKPEDLFYMDKAIFMAEGGHITYFGPANNYLQYFSVSNVIEVYSLLDGPNTDYWINKYNNLNPSVLKEDLDVSKVKSKEPNYILQYFWLSFRYLNIKINDSKNLLIMIGQAPAIALLLCLIFDKVSQVVPFFMAVSAIWFGANNAAREIVSEQKIYKRERMFNLGIFPYLFSKVTVLGLVALVQSILFTSILFYRYNQSNFGYTGIELSDPVMVVIWMTYLSLAATIMGLLISSFVNNTEKVMSIIPVILIPQIMLAGVVVKIKFVFVELLSYLTLSRWGTSGFAKIQENIAIPKPIVKPGTGKFLSNGLFEAPVPMISEKEDSTVNAISEMSKNFLESATGKFEPYNDTVNMEFFIITGISIVFFIALYLSMQSKDSLKIYN